MKENAGRAWEECYISDQGKTPRRGTREGEAEAQGMKTERMERNQNQKGNFVNQSQWKGFGGWGGGWHAVRTEDLLNWGPAIKNNVGLQQELMSVCPSLVCTKKLCEENSDRQTVCLKTPHPTLQSLLHLTLPDRTGGSIIIVSWPCVYQKHQQCSCCTNVSRRNAYSSQLTRGLNMQPTRKQVPLQQCTGASLKMEGEALLSRISVPGVSTCVAPLSP